MGSFADRAINTAKKLIGKYGNSVTLVDRTSPLYDPSTGEDITTPVYYPMKGSVSNYTHQDGLSPNIEVTDLRVLVESQLTINKEWTVEIGLISYEVIDVTIISTQDEVITQAIQIRG